jgi:hypothetical protein
MTPLRSRLRHEEGGWALVTAIILMSVMLRHRAGLLVRWWTPSRARRASSASARPRSTSRSPRCRPSSSPSRARPGGPARATQTNPYPQCTQASTDLRCPNDAQLRSAFTSVDLDPAATWETSVRDNNVAGNAEDFYDDAQTAGLQGYDTNGDGKVWVRARATAKGKTRTLVAMVRIYSQSEDVPKSALIAGKVYFSNAGNKAFVVGGGPVQVRCSPRRRTCASATTTASTWRPRCRAARRSTTR